MNSPTQRLTLSGIMIGMGTVLSFIKVFELPYGGSVTLFSMVPVIFLGLMYGPKWGLLCGAVYGALQGLLGAVTSAAFAGQDTVGVLGVLFLDYIVAFAVLGLAGMFRKIQGKPVTAFALGTLAATTLRFICHFISGVIIWGGYARSTFESVDNALSRAILDRFTGMGLVLVYSAVYNASYMIPETALAVLAAFILASVRPVREKMFQTRT